MAGRPDYTWKLFDEWLDKARTATIVRVTDQQTGTVAKVIYTVPANKVFFLTHAEILFYAIPNAVSARQVIGVVDDTATGFNIVRAIKEVTAAGINATAFNNVAFTFPLRYAATQSIRINMSTTGATDTFYASISGWLEDA